MISLFNCYAHTGTPKQSGHIISFLFSISTNSLWTPLNSVPVRRRKPSASVSIRTLPSISESATADTLAGYLNGVNGIDTPLSCRFMQLALLN